MARPQVAIVLPTKWSEFRDELGQPIWPDELAEAIDVIQDTHQDFEIHRMFAGSFDEQSSRVKLRLIVAESGHVLPLSSIENPGPVQPIGEDVVGVGQSGLWATVQRVMTAYGRKYHQTD